MQAVIFFYVVRSNTILDIQASIIQIMQDRTFHRLFISVRTDLDKKPLKDLTCMSSGSCSHMGTGQGFREGDSRR